MSAQNTKNNTPPAHTHRRTATVSTISGNAQSKLGGDTDPETLPGEVVTSAREGF